MWHGIGISFEFTTDSLGSWPRVISFGLPLRRVCQMYNRFQMKEDVTVAPSYPMGCLKTLSGLCEAANNTLPRDLIKKAQYPLASCWVFMLPTK